MSKPCMVIFDDGDLIQCPAETDPNCEGALLIPGSPVRPAIFPDRASARKAVRISTARERLAEAQGKSVSEDWTSDRAKYIKVVDVELVGWPVEGGEG